MQINNPLQKQKWLLPLVCSLLTSSFLILTLLTADPFHQITKIKPKVPIFVESKLQSTPPNPRPRIPRLAYLISGSSGDCESLKRALKALYHPLNQYVVHLDLEAPVEERIELVNFVTNEALFKEVGNVRVIVKSNLVTYRGPTMVTNTLHGAAVLLKEGGDWDWFINLSASDYPLVTQDDMLHTLSNIPRQLNFIEHTSDIGWKESQRAKPVIIDPGLYTVEKSDLFWASGKRKLPTAFKLFTGDELATAKESDVWFGYGTSVYSSSSLLATYEIDVDVNYLEPEPAPWSDNFYEYCIPMIIHQNAVEDATFPMTMIEKVKICLFCQ